MTAAKKRAANTTDVPTPSQSPVPWVAPSQEEFQGLKRYKSFLLPPSNSYYLGEFVWLPHENSRPASYSPPPPKAKKPRRSLNSVSGDPEGGNLPQGLDEQNDEIDERQRETDARWKAGFWLGRIVEIRARDTSFVWLKVRWMCRTVKELRDQDIKTGLPKGKVGGREIFMLGPEFDALQPVGAVEGRAHVILFDETNPMQEPFDERAIFYRSEARIPTPQESEQLFPKRNSTQAKPPAKSKAGKKIDTTVTAGHLFPFKKPTCYCGQGYLPLSEHPETMALCPHPDCLKWFHLGCLDWKARYRRVPTPSSRDYIKTSGLQLLSFPAEAVQPVDPKKSLTGVSSSSSESSSESKTKSGEGTKMEKVEDEEKRKKMDNDMPEYDEVTLSKLDEIDSYLPSKILLAAQAPIFRGPGVAGIVGNARKIVSAREILTLNRVNRGYGNLKSEERPEVKDEMGQETDVDELIENWSDTWGEEQEEELRGVIWHCPSCQSPM
ncbi:hypothetical protein IAR55_004673 [Kwoniella newhampshirensis]|uniref:BAH domain-containing protein n=1 Tax=Kwoniella newhampshirensis TaxID=1651941 RepID=A0AAW0YP20_9TREE